MTKVITYDIILKSNRDIDVTNIPFWEYDNIVGIADSYTALWPSGKAKVCNTSIPGSIPGGASKKKSRVSGFFFLYSSLFSFHSSLFSKSPTRLFQIREKREERKEKVAFLPLVEKH